LGADDEVVEAVPSKAAEIGGSVTRVKDDQRFTMKDVQQVTFDLKVMGLSKDCYLKESGREKPCSKKTRCESGKERPPDWDCGELQGREVAGRGDK
jgi:hypothetical protein